MMEFMTKKSRKRERVERERERVKERREREGERERSDERGNRDDEVIFFLFRFQSFFLRENRTI